MNITLSKRNRLTAAFIIAVLWGFTGISIVLFLKEDFNVYDNKVRVILSKEMRQVEMGIYKSGQYPYLVFGLDGKVLYGEKPFEEKVEDQVNVQEMLQFDEKFFHKNQEMRKVNFVLEDKGGVNGFVIFLVPEQAMVWESQSQRAYYIFMPLMIGIFLSIAMVILRTNYFNWYILNPIRNISRSAKGIIAGNYDLEVVRVFGRKIEDNEVGELTYSFELMRDELKEKQVREEFLKKSQQELISCISHDLKTPLSTIKAYSEGLRDQIAKTPEKQKEYADIILNKTDLLIGMIEELLEYSNAELKQLNIQLEELYFKTYFEPLMKELDHYVHQKGIEFSYAINVPEVLVTIDKKRITEVMYNLIENSMKYMGNTPKKIEVHVEREENYLIIKVIDNGIGISSDDIPYVFDKFYRGEKSRSTSVPGSGLGLSICKYIITEHNGEIFCKSRLNQGCEISFTLRI